MPKYFIVFGSPDCPGCVQAKEVILKTPYKNTLIWYDLGPPHSEVDARTPKQNENRATLDSVLAPKGLAPNTSMPRIFCRCSQDKLWLLQNGYADLQPLLLRKSIWSPWLKGG